MAAPSRVWPGSRAASSSPPLPARNEWGEDQGEGSPMKSRLLSPALSSIRWRRGRIEELDAALARLPPALSELAICSNRVYTNSGMASAGTQPPKPPPVGPHLVLYDGECGLCQGVVQLVLPRDAGGRFHFAALQGPVAARHLAPLGGVPAQWTTVYVLPNYQAANPACLVKARAALFIFRELGWPWRAVSWLGFLPTSWLDRGYDWVARNRYRFFGRHDACLMPRPEYRDRFLDSQGGVAPRPEVAR